MSSTKHHLKAIITDKRGRVLSVGENSFFKTHTLQFKHAKKMGMEYKPFLHAEISAIVKCRDLSKAYKISVFRFNKQGKPMNARPCVICMSAIKEAGISKIEWTI